MNKVTPLFVLVLVVLVGCATADSVRSRDESTIEQASAFSKRAAASNVKMMGQMEERDTRSSVRATLLKSLNAELKSQEILSGVISEPVRVVFERAGKFRLRQLALFARILDAIDAHAFSKIDGLMKAEVRLDAQEERYLKNVTAGKLKMSEADADVFLDHLKERQREWYGKYAK